ncbi:MAG: hypothetical protein H7Y38_20140, partial [Armatimonadetes bacterium]|nr:hypothetical protein [Armatimonadota bacterium]
MELSETLVSWCVSVIGAFTLVSDCSHPHGESQVWQLKATTGETYYLKAHRRSGKRDREVWAYRHVVPDFQEFAPRLVAIREELPQALLLSALPGEPMECIALTHNKQQAAWHRAGTVLRRYHSVQSAWFGRPDRNGEPQDGAQPDAQTFWQERFGDWLARAEKGGYLSNDETD